ncbi:TolC family protein [Saccharicrinis sp. FJH62]|uniref:TolC family protein n=1 Tax=Saccharicrinis sp. FJH62 TaxID=3344657 RepID=UPI0035D4BB4E
MKKNFLLTVIAFLFISSSFQGQTIHRLTLDKCVELAGEQSFQMRKSKSAYEIAKYQYLIQISRLNTSISFNFNPDFDQRYNPDLDFKNSNGENLHKSNRSFSTSSYFSINQPLPTGGDIYFSPGFSTNKAYYFSRTTENDISELEVKGISFSPSLRLVQPLNVLYAYNDYIHIQEKAELNFESADLSYRQIIFLNQFNIGNIYFNLQNILKNIETQKMLLSIKQKVYNTASVNSKKDSSELLKLEIEIERTKTKLNNYYHSYTGISKDLKEQLALPVQDSLILTKEMQTDEYLFNSDQLIRIASERHLLIKKYNIEIKLDELKYKEIESQILPQIDLTLRFNPYASVTGSGDLSYLDLTADSWYQSKRRIETLNDLSVGLSIGIPIYDGKRTRNSLNITDEEIRINKINIEEQEQLIQKNIHTLVEQIAYTLENIKIIETTMESSQQNMEDGIQKFYNEETDTYRLAYDLKLWEDAQLNYSAMQTNYNLLINRLEYEILDHLENVQ